MNEKVKALGLEARKLSPDERIALVEDVLASLPTNPVLDELWAKEAEDRLAAYRDGEMASISLEEIMARYRRP